MRRDLRLRDHAALALATARAERLAVVFVFDRNILDALEDRDDRRVGFIHASLAEMDAKLRSVGSRLVVRVGDPTAEIPRLVRELDAEAVFAARDAEPYAKARDREVARRVRLETVKDAVVFEGGEIPEDAHREFERRWRERLVPGRDVAYHQADRHALWPAEELSDSQWSLETIGFAPQPIEAGEDAARARLREFLPKLARYRQDRSRPDLDGTSRLSPHLRFGTLSVRECVRAALAHPSEGARKWLGELIWRDYYHAYLDRHPEAVDGPVRPRALAPSGRPSHGAAWREGRTGYPLIDAAMRSLVATGLMPNRLRIVAASFYANQLRLDPKDGEAWFARHLLDFDLANNNGGWQWCAGTDPSAPPYPRLVSPIAQSERYDPEGAFILRWVPEVRELIGPALHFPSRATPLELEAAGIVLGEDYPWPIVDPVEARRRAGGR